MKIDFITNLIALWVYLPGYLVSAWSQVYVFLRGFFNTTRYETSILFKAPGRASPGRNL